MKDEPTIIPPDDDGVKEESEKAMPKAEKLHKIHVQRAHALYDHPGETALSAVATANGWKLIGEMGTCDSCIKAKVHAKAVPKTSSKQAINPGECLFLDTSGPYKATRGKN